ncbi:MDR family MFS transporter [Paenibacillus sp. NAIST15-1]|uniref:MDR family MFS transporter n=1 Tax=Paenibacillus sp. NAIST15-1 TaxID=1605994 RepID=UPI00086B293E|nr:MDR family MFS transporter [Paenibacillus sp. NAIST15-1]GAV15225.1 multidrug resistance protein 3 [Paenibacillus sp. NAIST15-1]
MGSSSRARITVIGLLLGLLIVSLDQTIISTAVPTIVAKLGGFEQYVWLFSAYLIASVACMPLFGKLSDMYGRKRFFMLGIIVFMVGSALCGMASSMQELIWYRAIQGIGGGALMPVVFTILFDIFPEGKRAKMTGMFGAVFGLSSVFGPMAGAFFSDHLHWRWIFYVNLPLGLIALLLVMLGYQETLSFKKQQIDWLGTFTLVAAILCFMFGLEMGGKDYAWSSPTIISLFAGAFLMFVLFIIVELKVQEPVVPLGLFKSKLFTASMGAGLLIGMLLMAGATFIPLFIQGVVGGSATNASTVLTPMMLALVCSTVTAGFLLRKMSFRNIMLISGTLLLLSVVLLSQVTPDTSMSTMVVYMIMMGLGIGASFPVTSIAAQHKVDYQQRGTVNSLVRFFQTLGNTLGISILGSIQTSYLRDRFSGVLTDPKLVEQLGNPQVLLQDQVRSSIPEPILKQLTSVLSDSIAHVYAWSIPIAVLSLLFILLMGRVTMVSKHSHGSAAAAEQGGEPA